LCRPTIGTRRGTYTLAPVPDGDSFLREVVLPEDDDIDMTKSVDSSDPPGRAPTAEECEHTQERRGSRHYGRSSERREDGHKKQRYNNPTK